MEFETLRILMLYLVFPSIVIMFALMMILIIKPEWDMDKPSVEKEKSATELRAQQNFTRGTQK